MDSIDGVTVAKFLAVPTAFLLSGFGASFSQITLPLLYNQPASVSTPVFSGVYYGGGKVVGPGAIVSTLASIYLAYVLPEQRIQFATAATLTLGVPVFTGVVMHGGINKLLKISESVALQAKADASGEAVELMKTWAVQNWIRASMPFVAGLIGLWAIHSGTRSQKVKVRS